MPTDLYQAMLRYYQSNVQNRKIEFKGLREKQLINYVQIGSSMVELSGDIRNLIINKMQPIMEEWAGMPMVYTRPVWHTRVLQRKYSAQSRRPSTHAHRQRYFTNRQGSRRTQ